MSGVAKGVALTGSPSAPWWRQTPHSAWHSLALGGLGWMFDVCDNFMLALTISALIVVFGLSKSDAGAIGSVLAAGLVLGGIIGGGVADRIGRVRTPMLCVTIYSVFSVSSRSLRRRRLSASCVLRPGSGWAEPGRRVLPWLRRPGCPSIAARAVR